jgi:hypothetical protein
MNVDRLGSAVPMGIPDLGKDLASSYHRPRVESQQSKQIELFRGKGQFLASQQHTV